MPEEETPELEPVVETEMVMGKRITIQLLRDNPITFEDPALELQLVHSEHWVLVQKESSLTRSGQHLETIAMINTTEVRIARIDDAEYEVPITAEPEPEPEPEVEVDEEPPGEPGTPRPDSEKAPAKKASD